MITTEMIDKAMTESRQPGGISPALALEMGGKAEPADLPLLLGVITNPDLTPAVHKLLVAIIQRLNDPRALAFILATKIADGLILAHYPVGSIELNDTRINLRVSPFDSACMETIQGFFPGKLNDSDAIRFALAFAAMILNAEYESSEWGLFR